MNGRERPRVAIIGGGITGLAAAYRLTELASGADGGIDIVLLEAGRRVGGVIRTRSYGEFLLECGPDSFITQKPWALKLCRRLGLESSIVKTSDRYRRTFVAFDGRLHPLPEGFFMLAPSRLMPFATSSLFSVIGKLRMAAELFVPKGPPGGDESLAQFVRRRLGQEALERVAQPMIGGIYTADPEVLSLRATMPRFIELEQRYGSVIRGLLRGGGGGGPAEKCDAGARYSLFVSLEEGLQSLCDTISARLPTGSIRLDSPVLSVTRDRERHLWSVALSDGERLEADAVIVALPANKAAPVLQESSPELAAELGKVTFASSAVVNLIYARKDVAHPLDGFGFVVPHVEKRSIIACSFSSVKFPHRAPAGKVILRAFLGGVLQPEVYAMSDERLELAVQEDLEHYLGITAAPLSSTLSRYPESMPQYHVGHLDLVARAEQLAGLIPGLALAGNSYHGVGIPDCVGSAETASEKVFEYLQRRGGDNDS